MAQRTYEGDPIDGTMKHLAKRDLDEEAENVEVPSEETHKGNISTEYGFLDDDELTKNKKVQMLWEQSDYEFEEWGSLTQFYEQTVCPVMDVSQNTCGRAVRELESSNETETDEESEPDGDNGESTENSISEDGPDAPQIDNVRQIYTQSEIEHDVLKPLVFTQRFASGDELEALEQVEELIQVLLNKGDER